MKIVAGLGSIDEYIKFAEAGADEFFLWLCSLFLVPKIRNGTAP